MPEFLVHFEITLPVDLPDTEREKVYAAEKEACGPYFAEGTFKRVWRVPGCRSHVALWDAPDADYIHQAYESFPMYQRNWGRVTRMQPLAVNPNDPGQPSTERPDVPMTYPYLRTLLDQAKNSGTNGAMEHGLELCPGVSIHDHPGTDRGRQLHFMVDGQKLAELGPLSDEGEDGVGPNYVDFLARWQGRPVRHAQWEARIRRDNDLLHPDYEAALAAQRHRHLSHSIG